MGKRWPLRTVAVLFLPCFVVACGTTSFVVVDGAGSSVSSSGVSDAGQDVTVYDARSTGSADASHSSASSSSHASDAEALDAHPRDATAHDAPVKTDTGVDAGPPVIFVAHGAGCDGGGAGTPTCPYHTIRDGLTAAMAYTGPVTVHVAGGTPLTTYAETDTIVVPENVTLHGDGAGMTAIVPTTSTSSACGTNSSTDAVIPCAVVLAGELDGFTVTSPLGNGVVTVATTAGGQPPVIQNSVITGSNFYGVCALGSVNLGPDIVVNANTLGGVESPAAQAANCSAPVASTGLVHVISPAGAVNTFDRNGGNGIDLSGGATLSFEGGSASKDTQGIRLDTIPPGSHTITNLVATGNTGPGGLVVYGGQNLTLRGSNLRGNTSVGLLYDYVNGSTLDIGLTVVGDDTFGGVTAANNNGKAGILLCGVTSTLQTQGDVWSSCIPSQAVSVGASCAVNATYSDVVFFPGSGSLTIVDTDGKCTSGP